MLYNLIDFLEPINKFELSNDEGYRDAQLGAHIIAYEEYLPSLQDAHIILVGCNEWRGSHSKHVQAADAMRAQIYSLYQWHTDINIVDIGNVKNGDSLADTYVALSTILADLLALKAKVLILGGSHDITLAQYQAHKKLNETVEVVCIDAAMDISWEDPTPDQCFLMEMLTSSPNFVKHYSHIGFQSYLIHPRMLETIDKLGFECFRVGKVKDDLAEVEPVFRNSQICTVDITAIQHAHAPCNTLTPNGFTGEEICTLLQYAGSSNKIRTVGLYGYKHNADVHQLTAKQVSHMFWYFVNGVKQFFQEPPITELAEFNTFYFQGDTFTTTFLQSKQTGKWWVQLPNDEYIACSYNDYVLASRNEVPERFLRAVERM